MVGLDRVNEIRSRVQANIEVLGVHDHVLDGATNAVHGACDDPHPHASHRLDLRDLAGFTSWYLGSIILFVFGRFTQSWKPPMRCRSTFGISWWMIPLPDVIHWTSPEPMIPLFPRLSSCSTRPSSMYVTVSIPRCGCQGKPATYSAGFSDRKSSRRRNGSRRGTSAAPKARCRCTPAPSIVGRAARTSLMPRGLGEGAESFSDMVVAS